MNDLDLERWCRDAGTAIRSDAERTADAPAALARLHAAVDGVVSATGGRLGSARRRGLIAAAAGLVAASVVVIAVVVSRSGRDAIETSATAPVTDAAATTSVPTTTVPQTAPVTAPITPATVPATTAPPEPVERRIELADVTVEAGPRPAWELFRTTIGGGPGELGIEECDECDPVTPWTPISVAGRVVIADQLNRKWIVATPGEPVQDLSFLDGFRPISPPAVAPDGSIWVVDGGADGPAPDAMLRRYAVASLRVPEESHPVPDVPNSSLWFDGGWVIVNGEPVARWNPSLGRTLPRVAWSVADTGEQRIEVSDGAGVTTWIAPIGVAVGGGAPSPLADGSLIVVTIADQTFTRLFPHGRAARYRLPGNLGFNGTRSTDERTVVQLEREGDEVVVRRYVLPIAGSRRTVAAAPFTATGTTSEVCSAALASVVVGNADGSADPIVLADTTIDTAKLVVCGGSAASGQGVVALVGDGGGDWQLANLGLGIFYHAGDIATVATEGTRASVGYESMVGEDLADAVTLDGGMTWTVGSLATG